MGSGLTIYVLAAGTVMWESVDSCRSCTDDVVVCDMGMTPTSRAMVDDYVDAKSGVSVVHYGTTGGVCLNLNRDTWNMMVFGNEVIHEDSCHFIWEIADSHNEIEAVFFRIALFNPSMCSVPGEREDLRMFSPETSRHTCFDGESFSSICPRNNVVPADICPNPIWKFSFKPFKIDASVTPEVSKSLPKSTRRFLFRSFYSTPCVQRRTTA